MTKLSCIGITGFSPQDIAHITKKLNEIEPIVDEFGCSFYDFDYPDYAGIAKRIYTQFSGDQVDAIQDLFWGQPPAELTTVEVARALARGMA